MKNLIENFTHQLTESYQIGVDSEFIPTNKNISSVVICGLGGSGIGGKIIQLLTQNIVNIPVVVTNDYETPAFVNENTLVIASSYSGNTEETIHAVKIAMKKKAEIAVITSGGELLELADKNQWNKNIVPGGEQPRAMLAYSLIQLLFLFKNYALTDHTFTHQINHISEFISQRENEIKYEAKSLAKQIVNKQLVIYSSSKLEGVAVRFRQQMNENSKELCWHHVLPEMNHNELVGWAGGNDNLVVIKLNSTFDFYRTQKRWDICKSVISEKTKNIFEINSQGDTLFAQELYLIHLTDWISYYVAELKAIDPVEVDVIMKLKSELAKLK